MTHIQLAQHVAKNIQTSRQKQTGFSDDRARVDLCPFWEKILTLKAYLEKENIIWLIADD